MALMSNGVRLKRIPKKNKKNKIRGQDFQKKSFIFNYLNDKG